MVHVRSGAGERKVVASVAGERSSTVFLFLFTVGVAQDQWSTFLVNRDFAVESLTVINSPVVNLFPFFSRKTAVNLYHHRLSVALWAGSVLKGSNERGSLRLTSRPMENAARRLSLHAPDACPMLRCVPDEEFMVLLISAESYPTDDYSGTLL